MQTNRQTDDSSKLANETVLVVGATSIIGQHLMTALVDADYDVVAVSRQTQSNQTQLDAQDGVIWYQSREDDDFSELPASTQLIHLAPLWILPDNLEKFVEIGIRRIVAFSSTTRFSKKDSPLLAEREVAGKLELAEQHLTGRCKALNIDLTILRPTLVFELAKDQNISTIVNFIRRFGFFCVIGQATGLRQPVSAKDLAFASIAALENQQSYGKAYNLVGNPTLSYKAMVAQVFKALDMKPRILSVPMWFIRLVLPIARLLPRYKYLNIEMFGRMNQDLVFDSEDAVKDFDYKVQKFTEALSQVLKER